MDADGWTEIACASGSADCKSIQSAVTQVLEEAGIPVKREKALPAEVSLLLAGLAYMK